MSDCVFSDLKVTQKCRFESFCFQDIQVTKTKSKNFQPLRASADAGWGHWQHEGKQPEYLVQRKGEWIFSAYTIIAALVWRIMGFRFYSGAADAYMSPQKKGPQLAIKPTVTWHTMASEITGARYAIPDKCSVADLNTPPTPFSRLLHSPFLSSGTQEKEPNGCVCLLGQVNIWNDRGWRWLECWRRCLEAKWRTIRETLIRCMHVDSPAVFTLNSSAPSSAIVQWEKRIKLQWNATVADRKIKAMPVHMPKGTVTYPHRYYSCTVTGCWFDGSPL